jgi:hypothetical protein
MNAVDVVAVVMVGAALYEAVALKGKVPTITTLINRLPKLVRVGALLGALTWAVDHFEILEIL